MTQPIQVYLASENKIKRQALEKFLGRSVECVKTETLLAQPLGPEQALRCLYARIQDVLDVVGLATDCIVVAIENFVWAQDDDGTQYDECMIAVFRTSRGVRDFAAPPTCRVEVPAHLELPAFVFHRCARPLKQTLGQSISARFAKLSPPQTVDPADWFVAAGSVFNRQQQIDTALRFNRDKIRALID